MVNSILAASALVAVASAATIQKRAPGPLSGSVTTGWSYQSCAELARSFTVDEEHFFSSEGDWPVGFNPLECQKKCDGLSSQYSAIVTE
jgi:hypothetical protein